eukprot:686506_1
MEVDPQRFDTLFRTALATKAMDDAPTIQQNISDLMDEFKEEEEEEEEEEMYGGGGGYRQCSMIRMMCGAPMMNQSFGAAPEMHDMLGFADFSQEKKMKKKRKKKKQSFGGSGMMKKREKMQQIQLFKQVEQTKE